ncbi:nucleotidyltransferase domain-containing protein [Burkholderia sola]|uniref:nucleotidyltransferase domain-containing protein n=1 Tax=Burkholderia TaxID=32008 RepID=UPI001AE85BE5|nr:nucleotidyltransferase domain-containing protein [Burkholderia sp. AcTa6-5]MBP0714292.1 nucleotidyltransferase domain-containing protein [Burkholderia sp. AcTa6-5]
MENKNIIDMDFIGRSVLAAVLQKAKQKELEVRFVLMGGSFSEGLASSASDIDLVVVHDGEKKSHNIVMVVEGMKVEAIVLGQQDFLRIIGMDRQGAAGAAYFWQLDARRRLLFSRPIHGHDVYEAQFKQARLEDFIADLAEFQKSLAIKSFLDVKGAFDDALHEDDLRIRCRIHLEHSVDLLLSSLGDYYFREKYRVARIRRRLKGDCLALVEDSISALLSGRMEDSGSTSMSAWSGRVFAYSNLCQYLAAFSDFWPGWLTVSDFENFLQKASLEFPIGIFACGKDVLCQSRYAAFKIPMAFANAMTLRLLGLSEVRVAEGVEAYAQYESAGGRDEIVPADLVKRKLQEMMVKLGV